MKLIWIVQKKQSELDEEDLALCSFVCLANKITVSIFVDTRSDPQGG